MAEALLVNETLTELSLPKINISDEGAKELATAMKENKNIKLTELYLGGNNIGDEGG